MATCNTSKCNKPYSKSRYTAFGIITLIAFVLPFLRIGGNHLFLFSFDKKQLHLLFTTFDMQELYLMPFLLILLFLGIFFMTTLGGRIWCGWVCPQTIFRVIYRDLIETKLLGIRKNIKNKQTDSQNGIKKVIAVCIWSILAFLAASNFTWYFIPPEDFFNYIQNPLDHTVLIGILAIITGFLIYDVILLKEEFCVYVCPYARVQSVMFDNDTIQTIYNEERGGLIYDEHNQLINTKPTGENDECTGCEACVKICPTHIDIRKGMQLECINCLECADACTTVMEKLGKESLITWTSPNAIESKGKTQFMRFRTIAYGIALSIALVALFLMGSTKEHMLLNINKTTQLYKIKDKGEEIQNAYTFLFQNTDHKDHKYYFEVDNKDITIVKPSAPFKLKSGSKMKKVVILKTNKNLSTHAKDDTLLNIKITAYALDDKEKIIVFRNTTFIYPSPSSVKKYLNK
ncbi:cytochrome c oxidase accessory protein CcoG [Sulfurospirillum arcachonense]|uniref:cytochrome c oxidase accessory protein CcoG n=1 Tax=Sulfurospirillum arcachonense TaxID=57666 RepID=UPI00046A61C7|nr:cytochrome c oxidase accessory protein CcoG [Sulfurospirillum arcachonense]